MDRALTKCSCYLIFEEGEKVLLQKRKNSGFYDGYYSVPAGHWEYGETLKETVIRESQEELGIILKLEALRLRLVFKSYPNDYVGFFFTANSYQGQVVNNEPHKCAELAFFDYQNLPRQTIPYIKLALAAFKRGENLIEHAIYPPIKRVDKRLKNRFD